MYERQQTTEDKAEPGDYVREVTARYIGPRRRSVKVTSPEVAANFMRRLLRDYAREHVFALYLDASHAVVSYSLLSLGTANAASIHSREVFQGAILAGACAIILGHNHPSDDLTESREDIAATKNVFDAGTLIGIPLLDHIIFSVDAYSSLKEKGCLAWRRDGRVRHNPHNLIGTPRCESLL